MTDWLAGGGPYRAEPVEDATLAVQPGAAELFEGTPLVLRCDVKSGNHISYSWLLDDRPLPASAFDDTQETLSIQRSAAQTQAPVALCVAFEQ